MADSGDILVLWQASQGSAGGRAARLLAAAGVADAATLPLGEAARHLIRLRVALLGADLEAVANCPECEARHEAGFLAAVLLETPRGDTGIAVEASGWRVEARALTLADYAEAASRDDVASAEALLRGRAIVAARPPESGAEMPDDVLAAVEAALDAADPLADPRIALSCGECGASWEASFDAAAFLAEEIAAASRRLMTEVAVLARSYGWSERDILAIPPERRRVYLELAG
jgi:hypothetical protein